MIENAELVAKFGNTDKGTLLTKVEMNELNNKIAAEESARASADDVTNARIDSTDDRVSTVEGKIPSAATATNKLADKAYVNDAIQNLSAYPAFYDGNKNWFPTAASVTSATQVYDVNGDVITGSLKSDFFYVLADETAPAPFTGGTTRWAFAGETIDTAFFSVGINNSPLTQAQLDTIDSGITAAILQHIQDYKADKVVTPVNTSFDYNMADMPDAFTSFTWMCKDAMASGTDQFHTNFTTSKDLTSGEYTVVSINGVMVGKFSVQGVIYSHVGQSQRVFANFQGGPDNDTGDKTAYTDESGVTWTFTVSGDGREIKVTPSQRQFIKQKLENAGGAGEYIIFTDSGTQTFNLEDIIYEVRLSVLPRLASLETNKQDKLPVQQDSDTGKALIAKGDDTFEYGEAGKVDKASFNGANINPIVKNLNLDPIKEYADDADAALLLADFKTKAEYDALSATDKPKVTLHGAKKDSGLMFDGFLEGELKRYVENIIPAVTETLWAGNIGNITDSVTIASAKLVGLKTLRALGFLYTNSDLSNNMFQCEVDLDFLKLLPNKIFYPPLYGKGSDSVETGIHYNYNADLGFTYNSASDTVTIKYLRKGYDKWTQGTGTLEYLNRDTSGGYCLRMVKGIYGVRIADCVRQSEYDKFPQCVGLGNADTGKSLAQIFPNAATGTHTYLFFYIGTGSIVVNGVTIGNMQTAVVSVDAATTFTIANNSRSNVTILK